MLFCCLHIGDDLGTLIPLLMSRPRCGRVDIELNLVIEHVGIQAIYLSHKTIILVKRKNIYYKICLREVSSLTVCISATRYSLSAFR